jgi:AraC-like DNA-binding protein
MLLLDTADLPAEDRVEAFRAAFDQASVPCRIEHLGPDGTVRARMHLWAFGRATLFTSDSSGFRLVRTPRHVHRNSPPAVALAVQSRGVGQFNQFGTDQLVHSGELMLNDLTAPYAFSWNGSGGSCAFQVPYDQLGLPVDVVRAAGPRLRASPLYQLVRDHLFQMVRLADGMAADPGAAALGTATTELVRALLVSAAGRPAPELREQPLVTQVLAYAGQHLADAGLTPERIAGAHNVSVRQLYKACAGAGVRLEQWLIEQRLEAARAELAAPSGRRRSIAATARAHGFVAPSHFARRFRAAYGMTPRDWQSFSTP